jgi:subtilase-type serine protease
LFGFQRNDHLRAGDRVMKRILLAAIVLLLAACIPEEDLLPPLPDTLGPDGFPLVVVPEEIGPVQGAHGFPWNRYFVTEFDRQQVLAIRDLPGFRANDVRFNGQRSNALLAARLDYALSTGLTGAGQIVSMIDSAIRRDHAQFEGKVIHSSGRPPAGGDFHGTAVASVMAGNGAGGTLGFAPGADIHQGYMNYSAGLNWSVLRGYMNDAADLGAIVSNNSWGLTGKTVANSNVGSYFDTRDTRLYVDGLRNFAQTGVIVFAMQNDHASTSASLIAALPLGVPDLERNWIAVINAIPVFDDDRIISASRQSTACLETARFCMTANGQIRVATAVGDDTYATGTGASFAAPQVSGAVALLAEAFPDLTARQLRDRLLATADNGFFAHDGVVEFAPGVAHGYNAEFGHGFLDLRAALLPIGRAVVPLAQGGALPLGQAAIHGGAATGDALAQALAAVPVLSTDQLYGRFDLTGDVLTARAGRPDAGAAALMAAFDKAADPWAVIGTFLGGQVTELLDGGDGLTAALIAGEGLAGLHLARDIDLGQGALRLGLTSLTAEDQFMGITLDPAAGRIGSQAHALAFDLTRPLTPDAALRLSAEAGLATGWAEGVISDLDAARFHRIGLALEQRGVLARGDQLSVFLRQPVAVTQGQARVDLPVQLADGSLGQARHDIGLAPDNRQIDLGFAYQQPLSRATQLSLGLMASAHDGNTTGARGLAAFIGVQIGM